jgi:hypothetical protein
MFSVSIVTSELTGRNAGRDTGIDVTDICATDTQANHWRKWYSVIIYYEISTLIYTENAGNWEIGSHGGEWGVRCCEL